MSQPDMVRGSGRSHRATALGTGDTFAIPFDRVVPGVEIMATAVSIFWPETDWCGPVVTRGVDRSGRHPAPGLLVMLLAIRRAALG